MKIFDGFEEIEIVPWSECKDCTEHSRFTSQLSALFFLQRFRTYAFAMEPLRRLIRERQPGLSPATVSDQEMLEQAAHLLATGELHATLTPLMREGGRAPLEGASQTAAAGAQTGPPPAFSMPDSRPPGPSSYTYSPDSQGRPSFVQGRLVAEQGVRSQAAQRAVSTPFNVVESKMIDAAHLIAREFGGSGEAENLVPLPKDFNQRRIRDFEKELMDMLTMGQDLYLQALVDYQGTQRVPFQITYRVYRNFERNWRLLKEIYFSVLH